MKWATHRVAPCPLTVKLLYDRSHDPCFLDVVQRGPERWVTPPWSSRMEVWWLWGQRVFPPPAAGTEQHLAFVLTASVCLLARGSDSAEDGGGGFQQGLCWFGDMSANCQKKKDGCSQAGVGGDTGAGRGRGRGGQTDSGPHGRESTDR